MGGERRAHSRRRRYFDCSWVGQWGSTKSRISDLSVSGCYIESRFTAPAVGEEVSNITIPLGAESPLVLHGTVVRATRGIGFAVRFTDVDAEMRHRLEGALASR